MGGGIAVPAPDDRQAARTREQIAWALDRLDAARKSLAEGDTASARSRAQAGQQVLRRAAPNHADLAAFDALLADCDRRDAARK